MQRQKIKKFVPSPIWNAGSRLYWSWYNRGRHLTAKVFSPRWQQSVQQLRSYHNLHQGKRCFIIGNGPSLRKMDLQPLRKEITFGLNRIYLLFPELGFSTTYMVLINELVLEQCVNDLLALPMPRFITWRSRKYYAKNPGIIFLDSDYTAAEKFSPILTARVFEGFTVTFMAMQLAYYMGFSEAILIGVDHNYTTQGVPNTTVISGGDDPNHFASAYFGKGFRWQLPDLAGSERAYRLAKQAYEQDGRRILDATVGGKLTIFPKVEFETLFQGSIIKA